MTPEEKARVKIDKMLESSGWRVVSRDEFVPNEALAVKEGLMQGNKEADYLLFLMSKAMPTWFLNTSSSGCFPTFAIPSYSRNSRNERPSIV